MFFRKKKEKINEETFRKQVKERHYDELQYRLCETGKDSREPFVYGYMERDGDWFAYRTDENGNHDFETSAEMTKEEALKKLLSVLSYEQRVEDVLMNLRCSLDNESKFPLSHEYRSKYETITNEEFDSLNQRFRECNYFAEREEYPAVFEYTLSLARVCEQWLILIGGEKGICMGGFGPYKSREKAMIALLDAMADISQSEKYSIQNA